ncbi:diguanylate cyclase [Pseudoalteromonas fenneropenaei]|uniref:diguanylate cyclase n=1 Tax=Pseudoalteromonas fenneropenaei TaxID=1737459 RepID=A0ABV7CJ68_9GAMM
MIRVFVVLYLLIWNAYFACTHAKATEFWPLQQYDLRNWTVNDGLPQISVYDIVQDDNSYLWLATEKGVVRFDGEQFRTFNRSNTPLLENPRIQRLLWTNQQQMLIASSSALTLWQDDVFTAIELNQTESRRVTDMIQLPSGEVIVAAGQLYRLEQNSLHLWHTEINDVQKLLLWDQQLCVIKNNHLACLQGAQFQLHGMPIADNLQVNFATEYFGTIYVGTQEGLYKLAGDQWYAVTLPEQSAIQTMFTESNKTLWVGSDHALYRFVDGKFTEALDYTSNSPLNRIRSGFIDKHQRLWLGSQTSGLLRLHLNPALNLGSDHGFQEPFVWSISTAEQKLLIGTNEGLYQETAPQQFAPLSLQPQPDNMAIYTQWLNPKDSTLWLGTKAGLWRYRWPALTLLDTFDALAGIQVNGVMADSTGTIWIATQQGLWRYEQQQLTEVEEFADNRFAGIRYLYQSGPTLWIGTEKGLLRYHQGRFSAVAQETLANAFISFIGEMHDGKLMVGTFQHGLWIRHTDHWQQYSTPQGLPMDNVTYAEDTGKYLLWAGLQGVMNIERSSLLQPPLLFELIIDNTGFDTRNEFHRCCNGAGIGKGLGRGNSSYLPSVTGLIEIQHDLLHSPSRLTPPIIEQFFANDQLVSSPVVLSPQQLDWRIEFTVPHYERSAGMEFRYQLQGYDKEWKYARGLREARYTNLSGGNYLFLVEARHKGYPVWSTAATLPIVKQPFWFETWWFYILTICAVSMLIILSWKWRARTLLSRQKSLELQIANRTEELREANAQLQKANQQLLHASLRDALTGLHNRRYLEQTLPTLLVDARQKQMPLGVIIVDIDNFKAINDEFGHHIGDAVLIAMADILLRHSRMNDHVVRWGGEEFVILTENSSDLAALIERLFTTIRQAHWPHGKTVRCSAGVSCHPCDSDQYWSIDHTFELADKALYLVKKQGKDDWLWLQSKYPNEPQAAANLAQTDPQMLLQNPAITVIRSGSQKMAVQNRRSQSQQTPD